MYRDVFGVEVAGVEVAVLLLLVKPNVVHLVGVEERSKAAEFRLACRRENRALRQFKLRTIRRDCCAENSPSSLAHDPNAYVGEKTKVRRIYA